MILTEWNKLSQETVSSQSLCIFKSKLIKYNFYQYFSFFCYFVYLSIVLFISFLELAWFRPTILPT